MTLHEACQSCRDGNFVSHNCFDSSQSMHDYKHDLYYEDGAIISNDLEWLDNQTWAKDGWYIKYPKECVDGEKLDKMHKDNKGYMLHSGTFEDCIIKFA